MAQRVRHLRYACALLAAITACTSREPDRARDTTGASQAAAPNVTPTTSDSLRLELDVAPDARLGSAVPITLRVENMRDRPMDLYLRGREITFDIVVRRADGQVVWRLLADEAIPAILRLESLAPRQVLALHATWTPTSTAGAPVTPGQYTVQGVLFTDGPELRTALASLRILAQ